MAMDFGFISTDKLIDLYNKGTESDRELLRRLVDNPKIFDDPMSRIRTYEDACAILGITSAQEPQNIPADLLAIYKLQVITRALNGDWRHPQDGETEAWYVRGWFYDKNEIAAMSDYVKKDCIKVLLGGNAALGARCGLACVDSPTAWSHSYVTFGSRLAYKSEELADYSARQFRDLWAQAMFYLPENEKEEN